MSLQSAYELSQDATFKGRVLIALHKAVKAILADGDDDKREAARNILTGPGFFVDLFILSVAAEQGIDSSSSDDAIIKATRKAVLDAIK